MSYDICDNVNNILKIETHGCIQNARSTLRPNRNYHPIQLTNLNDKLQSMRDQLRMNVEHDLEYIKYKIEGDKK